MRITILTFLLFFSFSYVKAQVDTNKVYLIAEQMPLIPNCVALDTTEEVKKKCTQDLLLSFIYGNVQYPDSARLLGIEGTVVLSFVVGKDSTIKDVKILKDIGGGCGDAAAYVVNAMNTLNVRWAPGKMQGIPVDVKMTVPIKFKLKDPPPYVLVGRDTVYTTLDKPLSFEGGDEALMDFIKEKKKYPEVGNADCAIGIIEINALVTPSGKVRILELNDFNNLGTDFQFEAITAVTATIGKWNVAEYQGRLVPSSYMVRLDMIPTSEQCQHKITDFEKAQEIAIAGSTLITQGKQEAGIAKLDEAIQLFPNNAEYLYARGQAHLELNNMELACMDMTKVKEILLVSWVDNLLPIICNSSDKTKEAGSENEN